MSGRPSDHDFLGLLEVENPLYDPALLQETSHRSSNYDIEDAILGLREITSEPPMQAAPAPNADAETFKAAQGRYVERILGEVLEREAAVNEATVLGPQGVRQPHTTLSFNPMDLIAHEVIRFKYVLASLLQVRLNKICRDVHAIVGNPQRLAHLSSAEVIFAQSYAELEHRTMLDAGMRHLPEALRDFSSSSRGTGALSTPSAARTDSISNHESRNPSNYETSNTTADSSTHYGGHRHVFMEVCEDIGPWEMQGHMEEFREGDVYAVPYEFVSELVETGRCVLR